MALIAPFPDPDELLASIGEAGRRVSDIDASEGAAGNISIYIGWQLKVRRRFPIEAPINLPLPVPALANKLIIVTGSGRRFAIFKPTPLRILLQSHPCGWQNGANVFVAAPPVRTRDERIQFTSRRPKRSRRIALNMQRLRRGTNIWIS